ncbi:MAG: glycosyl hydrolase, partial [Cellvibrio sp.]
STFLSLPASVSAGKDQVAVAGATVNLSAVANGANLAPFNYAWSQISGPAITLVNSGTASASFIAPTAGSTQEALLKVVATDKNGGEYTDTIKIYIGSSSDVARYEAEAATLSTTNIATAKPGYSGTGYVTGFNDEITDSVTWTITINDAAYYRIGLGFQLDNSPKGFDFYLDSTKLTSTFTAADTNFHEINIGRHWLSSGSHTFVIKGGWSYYNIDYLELVKVAAPGKPQAIPATLADDQASSKTKALFKYITDNYGHKTLSGQQDEEELDTIFNYSERRPSIFAFDLNSYDGLAVAAMGTPANVTENYISKIQASGYIASLIWHWHSPADAKSTSGTCPTANDHCWWNSFYTKHSNFNLTSALADTNSAQYKAVIADIDRIAVQLKKLQEANIPVLWRPLHEADGTWFWWGAQGSDSYKKLWRLMYDRLTNHHQLHNLIWVLTIVDPTWYPGNDVVDVVGADAYPDDKHDPLITIWEALLERYDGHKVLALSEYGGVPFIDEMQAKGVWWAWFASWNDKDTSKPLGPKKMTIAEVDGIYNSLEVISQDELDIPDTDN